VSDHPTENRTEAPTPRRLQRAADTGQRPISRELSVCTSLAASLLGLKLLAPTVAHNFLTQANVLLQQPLINPVTAFRRFLLSSTLDVLPLIALPVVASVLAVGLQTGFAINVDPLRPRLDRISPTAGFARLFSQQNLLETAKAVFKLLALGTILVLVIAPAFPTLAISAFDQPRHLLSAVLETILQFCLFALALQAAIALGDIAWTRFNFIRSMRMTRGELKEETKDTEGDPHIKSRLRKLRFQRTRQRIRAAVPRATVVVTNPTEYAVALAYDRTRGGAPRVVAKGVNLIAKTIRELAQSHGIPLVANPPLARALYLLEIDAEIPPEHYKAVAEIIAYVWRLRAQVAPRAP
jgi:flagellar biosynthesis protein FlhB